MDRYGRYRQRLDQKLARFPGSQYFRYLDGLGHADLDSTILIEIAAFRDPELIPTMMAAITMAANPDRLHFAVCYQGDDDAEAARVAAFPNTRVKRFREQDAPGTCAARYEASRLYGGEDYVLHIDSHMRFASFWDACAIDQYGRCPGDKRVLTEYTRNYADVIGEPVDAAWFDENAMIGGKKIGFGGFYSGDYKPMLTGKHAFAGPEPSRGAFTCAHFLFGTGAMDADVPTDPEMFFTADEASIAARLWTHGYDIWHPGARFAYHLFTRSAMGVKRFSSGSESSRRSSNEDRRLQRLYMDGLDPSFGRFGLGSERAIEDYFAFAGVNYRSRMARSFAFDGKIGEAHDDAGMVPVAINGRMINGDGHPMRHADLRGVHSDVFFVIVTSYKAHNELVETVRSLFWNADDPGRVRVLVVAQLTDEEWLDRCRELGAEILPCEAKGAGNAQNAAEELIPDDAAYVIYSEEHMYYAYGWDTALASYMRYCGKRAVISDWGPPLDYGRPFPVKPWDGCVICARSSRPYGHANICFGRMFHVERPVRGAFVIGHNVVTSAEVARSVRHSPDMYMNSNESYMSYRYWCAGIDVYHAPYRYCFHFWNTKAGNRNGPADVSNSKEYAYSGPRMKYLLGIPGGDPSADTRYALDNVRSLASFIAFSGFNPLTGAATARAQLGMFMDDVGAQVTPKEQWFSREDGDEWFSQFTDTVRAMASKRSYVGGDDGRGRKDNILAFRSMRRSELEAVCGSYAPKTVLHGGGELNNYSGSIRGLGGSSLSILPGAKVILHRDARLFVLGSVTVDRGTIIEVHAGADLVLGEAFLDVDCVVDCWKRIDILDAHVCPNAFIADRFGCDMAAGSGERYMEAAPVHIGPHAWIAAGSFIMPGTDIADAVTECGSAVSGSVRADGYRWTR